MNIRQRLTTSVVAQTTTVINGLSTRVGRHTRTAAFEDSSPAVKRPVVGAYRVVRFEFPDWQLFSKPAARHRKALVASACVPAATKRVIFIIGVLAFQFHGAPLAG